MRTPPIPFQREKQRGSKSPRCVSTDREPRWRPFLAQSCPPGEPFSHAGTLCPLPLGVSRVQLIPRPMHPTAPSLPFSHANGVYLDLSGVQLDLGVTSSCSTSRTEIASRVARAALEAREEKGRNRKEGVRFARDATGGAKDAHLERRTGRKKTNRRRRTRRGNSHDGNRVRGQDGASDRARGRKRNERKADGCGWMRSQADFEKRVDPNNKEQMSLLEEMRKHTEKVRTHARFMCDAADATPVPHARG